MSQELSIEVRFVQELPGKAGAEELELISAMLPELLKLVQQLDDDGCD